MNNILLSRKREAEQWAKANQISQKPLNGEPFCVGEVVTFSNDYGIKFEGNRIIGFCDPIYPNSGTVYLDICSFWFPNKPEQLSKA